MNCVHSMTVMERLMIMIQITRNAGSYRRNQGLITVIDATESRR